MKIKRTEIIEKLKDIVAASSDGTVTSFENVNDDTKLIADLGFTSVRMLFMVIAIEESFGIVFDDVGMADFQTFGNVVDYIEGKLS